MTLFRSCPTCPHPRNDHYVGGGCDAVVKDISCGCDTDAADILPDGLFKPKRGKLEPDRVAFLDWLRDLNVFAVPIERGTFQSPSNFELLRYEHGYYNGKSRSYIRGMSEAAFHAHGLASDDSFNEGLVKTIGATPAFHKERVTFNPPGKLCLANGVLDATTGTVSRWSSDVVFTWQIPVAYNADAACPNFDKFLADVQPDEAKRALLIDLMGYCLLSRNPFQKMFALVGDGSNGKSVFKNVLTEILGKEAVASESLYDLSHLTFNRAELLGTLVNVSADEQYNREIRDTSTLKKLIGDDEISVQRKHQHPVKMRYGGKILVLMNRAPPVDDDTYAFWRRVIVIPFPVTFVESPNPTYPNAPVADPLLMDKLRPEYPGILNRMLEGLARVRSRSQFDPLGLFTQSRNEWAKRANPIREFVEAAYTIGAGLYVPTREVYDNYVRWCESTHAQPLSNNIFGKALMNAVRGVYKDKREINKRTTWVYFGFGPKMDPDTPPSSGNNDGVVNTPKSGLETGQKQLAVELAVEGGKGGSETPSDGKIASELAVANFYTLGEAPTTASSASSGNQQGIDISHTQGKTQVQLAVAPKPPLENGQKQQPSPPSPTPPTLPLLPPSTLPPSPTSSSGNEGISFVAVEAAYERLMKWVKEHIRGPDKLVDMGEARMVLYMWESDTKVAKEAWKMFETIVRPGVVVDQGKSLWKLKTNKWFMEAQP